MLTRDELIQRGKKTKIITLDDGSSLTIRKLSQIEVEEINHKYSDAKNTLAGFRFIVSRCVVDEAGTRLFKDGDQAVQELDFETVQDIASQAVEYAGLGKDPKKKGDSPASE